MVGACAQVLYLELNFGDWWRALFFVIGIMSTFYGPNLNPTPSAPKP